MLVQVSIRNYKTFKEEAQLTLFASNYDKSTREQENVFEVPKFGLRLLRSAVIYGANASGKTKLIDAVHFMKEFVLHSSKESQQGEPIEVEPFRLNTATDSQPSMFEIVFIHEDEMYRYGFEVTSKEVISEWLYHRPNTKEVEIFYREGQNIAVHPRAFKKGNLLVKENLVRNNALMLSVAAQFNDEFAQKVLAWFERFKQLFGLFEDDLMDETIARVANPEFKQRVLNLLKLADTSIEDFEVRDNEDLREIEVLPKFLSNFLKNAVKETGVLNLFEIRTKHTVFNESGEAGNQSEFKLGAEESAGTAKFFALSGSVIHALERGEVLIMDELDSKIHPMLVKHIVELFNTEQTNPKNAQLIFNTHDTNLLRSNLFRRDQIWFVEKDRFGAATLYSLASFKTGNGARKTDNFEENYLQGRYGGVPVLGDFSTVFQTPNDAKK